MTLHVLKNTGIFQLSVSILTLVVFTAQWWSHDGQQHKLSKIFTSLLSTFTALALFQHLQLHRNDLEDEIKMARSKLPVAPGLALPFFQIIEEMVKGNPER